LVGVGVEVEVGGRWVFVGGTRVGVAVFLSRWVAVGVRVMKVLAVGVSDGISVAVGCRVSVEIGVAISSVTSTAVSATAVLMGLENAELTISSGSMSDGFAPGLLRAAAETMQIRLNPSTPAARTVNGAEYSRNFNSLLFTFTY